MVDQLNSDLRNFLKEALGYLASAWAGSFFMFILSRLGLISWLFGLIDDNQVLVISLGIPVFSRLMLALGGVVMGGIGSMIASRSILAPPSCNNSPFILYPSSVSLK